MCLNKIDNLTCFCHVFMIFPPYSLLYIARLHIGGQEYCGEQVSNVHCPSLFVANSKKYHSGIAEKLKHRGTVEKTLNYHRKNKVLSCPLEQLYFCTLSNGRSHFLFAFLDPMKCLFLDALASLEPILFTQ